MTYTHVHLPSPHKLVPVDSLTIPVSVSTCRYVILLNPFGELCGAFILIKDHRNLEGNSNKGMIIVKLPTLTIETTASGI